MLRAFSDPRCLEHESPYGMPEQADRVEAIVDYLRAEGVEFGSVGGREDALDLVGQVHDTSYIERFRHAVERRDGLLDSADNPLSAGTWDASLAAVEAVLDAVDWVADGEGRHAFAAVRPPGHHAERGMAMGFCYFNNIAVAAEYLIRSRGIERLAIVDYDVHHGNGTQHIFEARQDVLFASLHQFPFYPGTGDVSETGVGEGLGATLNVPLPAGTGDVIYAEAMQSEILPAVEAFEPEILLVSAGFDAWRRDPVGGMQVTERGYIEWGALLGELADRVCGGRVVQVLEGGYDVRALPVLAHLHLQALGGDIP